MRLEGTPIEVFISYSRRDAAVCSALAQALQPIEQQGIIKLWYDKSLDLGQEYYTEISDHIRTAHIVLALVSEPFLASKACASEIRQAMGFSEAKEKYIIPVIVERCQWQSSALGKFQAFPPGGQPLSECGNPVGTLAQDIDEVAKKMLVGSPSKKWALFSMADLAEMLASVEQSIATLDRMRIKHPMPPTSLMIDLAELETRREELKSEIATRAGRF